MEDIAIITVNYNNYTVTEEYLDSFEKQDKKDFHIFIADSSDKRKNISKRSFATVFRGQNKGYAHGINVGIKQALYRGYHRFVVMNNDTEVGRGFISAVCKSLNKYPESIIGGRIHYYPGYEFHKSRYRKEELGRVFWYGGGLIDWENVHIKHRGVDEVDTNQYDELEETDFITGCFMCFDKKVIEKVGFWDTSYFMYYEDADWCERAKRKGIKLCYDPAILLWHKNAQSTGGSGSTIHERFQRGGRLRFGLKYAPYRVKLHLILNLLLK